MIMIKNTFIYFLLIGLISCSNSNYYEVQFDNVDQLMIGDKVFIKGLEVGQVKKMRLDDDNKVLATLSIGQEVKLTRGSTFTIHADLLGTKHIEINLADNLEPMDKDEVHKGYIQLPDTSDFKKLTTEEMDSLVKHDPIYRLADTIMTILRKSKDSTKVKN